MRHGRSKYGKYKNHFDRDAVKATKEILSPESLVPIKLMPAPMDVPTRRLSGIGRKFWIKSYLSQPEGTESYILDLNVGHFEIKREGENITVTRNSDGQSITISIISTASPHADDPDSHTDKTST